MIRLIVACDQKMGIAKHGVQPWSIPDDEEYFSQQTKKYGARVLMGRKTYEVMGGALKDRENIVATSEDKTFEGAKTIHDIQEYVSAYEDVWVIGGASIYAYCMEHDLADELYVTKINADFDCDRHFPSIDLKLYEQTSASDTHVQNGFEFQYVVYKKITA